LLRTISQLEDDRHFAEWIRKFELIVLRNHSHVLELIQAAPNLSRLEVHYRLDQSIEEFKYSAHIKGSSLSSAMSCAKNTLKHLKISYELMAGGFILTHPTTSEFCSLQQLNCLQTVEIPFFLLLGCFPDKAPAIEDVLPRNLSILRFGDDVWWFEGLSWDESLMMEKFLEYIDGERWKEITPKLKNVIFSLCGYDYVHGSVSGREWLTDGGESDFKRLCSQNRLRCEVIRDHYAT
jgi:hypothetical protein